MNLIELSNVSKAFKTGDTKTVAVNNINLNIKQGDFVAIMGASGSGKSTLLSIIGLLDVPSSGEYRLAGESIKGKHDRWLARFRREKIGFVFQSFNLIPRSTVAQNVELPMVYAGWSKKDRTARVKELLEQVGLARRAKNQPNQISGGETQRAAIARALANHPSLILADEPTGNLDSKTSLQIMQIFKKLHEDGNTIVLITHEPHLAAFATHLIELRDGEIVRRK